jgi:thiamine biosynthesis lipoprotein
MALTATVPRPGARQQLLETMRQGQLQGTRGYWRATFTSMNTRHELQFAAPSQARARAFLDAAQAWLADFEARYSANLPDSLISAINASDGQWVAIDPETEQILALCGWYHWSTDGAYDPTLGPLLALWRQAARDGRPPAETAVQTARRQVGWEWVERRPGSVRLARPGMRLDLGGIGKEYAVDRVHDLARAHGILHALVNLGRDVRAAGSPPEGGPWRIGLERPDGSGRCWNGVAVDNAALCCSGSYARGAVLDGVRHSHILDPRTGCPAANGVEAAWVLAGSAVEAGMLATAINVLGAQKGLQLVARAPGAEACAWSEGHLNLTGGFTRHVLDQTRLPT